MQRILLAVIQANPAGSIIVHEEGVYIRRLLYELVW